MTSACSTFSNKKPTKQLLLVLCLTTAYMVAEVIGGFLSNSLALLADAGHMLADVAALLMSLMAFYISSRPADDKATYGYYRAEVIAAFINGVVLLIVSFFIIKEAMLRFFTPAEVEPDLMLWVAFGGLVINIAGLFVLKGHSSSNINIKGAFLHVMSDTLGSIGVIFSGILIKIFNWRLVDPIMSIAIALLVFYSSIRLIMETLHVLMEHAPRHINPKDILEELLSVPEILSVDNLHVWSITQGKDALSAHVVVEEGVDYNEILKNVKNILQAKFGISHTTIQIEKKSS